VGKIYGASLDTIEALAQKKLKDAGPKEERFVCRANNWEVYRY
jgi:hypothetical protein